MITEYQKTKLVLLGEEYIDKLSKIRTTPRAARLALIKDLELLAEEIQEIEKRAAWRAF
ncbi:MAG TPA: hypothetical protein VNL14_13970 [Candidatus Acidoferrales bacterium]|nr:hypothetical protein [Candidatus Acidoferrales bacterium]